jgi:hypothetical protein
MDTTRKHSRALWLICALALGASNAAQAQTDVFSTDTASVILASAQIGAEGQILKQSGFWVAAVDRPSPGFYRLRLSGNTFLDAPTCTATAENSSAFAYFSAPPNTQTILVRMTDPLSDADKNIAFHLICMGTSVFTR